MPRERLYLFDTTLRDGAQTNGVDFTLADKLAIAAHARRSRRRLCRGRLSGRQSDRHQFLQPSAAELRGKLTAFGMTRRPGRSASNDPGLVALLEAQADAICFVAKSWDYHVRVALETTRGGKSRLDPRQRARRQGQGPRSAARLRAFLRWLQGQARLCAGLRARRPMRKARAGSCCATPTAARCRTRSSASSARYAKIFPATMSASTPITTPSRRWPIRSRRCAPARGRSRARSTGSASAAATPISISIIPTLKLKAELRGAIRHRRVGRGAAAARRASRTRSTKFSIARPNRHAPYVGESAFATKAGIHASAIMKEPATYEHVAPRTRRQQAQASGLRSGRPLQRARRARSHRACGRQGRSARRPPARRGQGARGDRLCL